MVRSLGVLLTLQASMLLAFTTLPHLEPRCCRSRRCGCRRRRADRPLHRQRDRDRRRRGDRGAYRWASFGVATRATSENEVPDAARALAKAGADQLAVAALIAGGVGIIAAAITELDTSTLPLQIVPALAAALLAGLTSIGVACAAGIGLGSGLLVAST